MSLSGPSFGPAAGGPAKRLVILLHGIGADGNDLIGLAPAWADMLPDTVFVSPNAPFPCDMAPYGHQWFSLQDRSPARMLAGIRATAPILDGFIDDTLVAHGLDDGNMALVGFSQGTMMSLFVAPRRRDACAGIVGYSGALLAGELLAEQAVARPPVVLVHGDADPIVPFGAMAAAAQALEAAGFQVETHGRPGLAHGIDPVGLEIGGRFLASVLAS